MSWVITTVGKSGDSDSCVTLIVTSMVAKQLNFSNSVEDKDSMKTMG
jgi:hypothetical protein